MSLPPEPARLQARALGDLFTELFYRGRQIRVNPKLKPANVRRGRFWAFVVLILVGAGLLATNSARYPAPLFATLAHAYTLLFGGITLIGASGAMLFNDEEPDILLHRPVAARTLLLAKVRVLLRSLWFNALALNLAVVLLGMFADHGDWRFGPAHALTLGLNALFMLSLTVLLMHLCLRWFGKERLQGLLTTSQVVAVVIFIAGAQLAPRMMGGLAEGPWRPSAWLLTLPPFWFGSLDALAMGYPPSPILLVGAALALGVTALLAWLAFDRLADSYEEAVFALQEHARAPVAVGGRRWTDRLADWAPVRWWLRDPAERAGFLLALTQITRVRSVKLRVFPLLIQFTSYPLVFVFGGAGTLGFVFIALPAVFAMVGFVLADTLRYSEENAGSDLFRYAPLASPGPLFFGARKALLLLTILPLMLLWTVVVLVATRDPSQLLRLVPAVALGLVVGLVPATMPGYLIFSQGMEGGMRMGRGCLMQLVPLVVGGAVGGLTWAAWEYGFYAWWLGFFLLALAVVAVFLHRAIARQRLDLEA
jgi:hypothetical protein